MDLRRQGDTTVNASIGRLRTSTRASSATADQYRETSGITKGKQGSDRESDHSTSPVKGLRKAADKAEKVALGVVEAENDDRQFDERVNDSSRDLGRNSGHGAADRTSQAVKRRHEKLAAKKKAARRGEPLKQPAPASEPPPPARKRPDRTSAARSRSPAQPPEASPPPAGCEAPRRVASRPPRPARRSARQPL